jgi:hypothetical protein
MRIHTPRKVASEQEQQDWVLSSFTNYDDACDHCSRTLPANSRWDTQYDKSVGWPSGANSASLEVDFGPGLSYMLPTNPAGGHSFNYGAHVYESWSGLGRDLGRISASREPDYSHDTRNGKASDVIVYYRGDVLLKGFLPYSALCQPLRHGQPPW